MTLQELQALADGKAPIPTHRVNVRTDYEPLMRQLKRVTYEWVAGERWLYWYWTPEQTGDVRVDCGYSGQLISKG